MLLFTHEDHDFGGISVTESSCTVPISKVERHIMDRFYTTLWYRVNWYSDNVRSEKKGARAGNHWDVSKIRSEDWKWVHQTNSANHSGTMFNVWERLVQVRSVPLQLSCQYKKLSTGLTLRAGGWGFPPATEHGPWLILWVNRHPIYLTIGNHHWKAVWLSDYSGGLAMWRP